MLKLGATISFDKFVTRFTININLMNFPLADKKAVSKFYNYNSNHGRSTLTIEGKKNYNPHHYVCCTTGDDLITEGLVAAPDIIKLDVEGFEINVINGLHHTLSAGKTRKIVFEASGQFLENPSQLKTILSGYEYKFEPLQRNEDTHHDLGNFIAYL